MDNTVVKSTIKYVKEHSLPFTSEELAVAIGVSAADAESAIARLAYLGIVEIDERDGRIFSNYESDFIIKFGALVKYIGDEDTVIIPEEVEEIGLPAYKPSDIEYGVPSVWNWASVTPREIVIPSTVKSVVENAFSDLPSEVVIIRADAFTSFCKEMCGEEYLSFFADKDSEYLVSDGKSQPCYIGIAKEFCDLFSDKYNDIYFTAGFNEDPLKEELDSAYGEYDFILQGDDLPAKETIDELTAVEIVAVLSILFDMEQLNTGYIAWCGRCGFITSLLTRLKNALEETV